MPARKLKDFLDQNQVKYVRITHSPAFTAQEVAQMAHVPGKELAKPVMLVADGRLVMAVVPASYQVDLEQFAQSTGAKQVELASEKAFASRFADCELGAIPPFGNLYDVPVFVAKSLAEDESFAFNAGSHKELFSMAYADFARLVKPTVLTFSVHATH